MTRPLCVTGCGRRGAHRHHVILEQRLPRRLKADARGLVWLCFDCHQRHHAGGPGRLHVRCLPDSVFALAGEALGPAAFDYFKRRYNGADPRVDALLQIPAPDRAPVGRRTRP